MKTACKFLCDLGFQRLNSSKMGVYVARHQSQDVLEEGIRYLDRVHAMEFNRIPAVRPSDVLQEHRPII